MKLWIVFKFKFLKTSQMEKKTNNRLKVLVKPQADFTRLLSEVESLCGEYARRCSCRDWNRNGEPDEDNDILF